MIIEGYLAGVLHESICCLMNIHKSSFYGLYVSVEALHPSQQFFSHGTFSWVEPVLSKEDEVSCLRAQHRAPGEILSCHLGIRSLALYQLS